MPIDTLKAKNRLVQEYGVDERQAEGFVEVVSSAEDKVVTTDQLDNRLQALGALNFFT